MDTANTSFASKLPSSSPPPSVGRAAGDKSSEYVFHPFGEDGMSFFDILDVINPLQHLPVISTIYRELTGDEIDPVPRLVGGTLFGGLIGTVASLVNVIVDEITGSDVGEHALALIGDVMGFGGEEPSTAIAQSTTQPTADPEAQPLMVPLVVASDVIPPVSAPVNIFDWPQRESAFKTAEGFERTDPRAEDLARKLAAIQQRELSRVALSALASYGKGQSSAEERQNPIVDISS
jgi:hypothetical protein